MQKIKDKNPDEGLVEMPKPIGDFVLKHAKGVSTDNGMYFHYSDVCLLLKKYKEEILAPKAEPKPKEDLFYVQDTHSFFAGYMIFLGNRERSTTANLALAKRFTKQEAKEKCIPQGFTAWSCDYVDKLKPTSVVGMQKLNKKFSRVWRGRAK